YLPIAASTGQDAPLRKERQGRNFSGEMALQAKTLLAAGDLPHVQRAFEGGGHKKPTVRRKAKRPRLQVQMGKWLSRRQVPHTKAIFCLMTRRSLTVMKGEIAMVRRVQNVKDGLIPTLVDAPAGIVRQFFFT